MLQRFQRRRSAAAGDESAQRWSFRAYEVGTARLLIAVIVFGLFVGSRVIGMSSPRDAMSDELLYAASAADYLSGHRQGEWTHPPLSKELMAASLWALARPHVRESALPSEPGTMWALEGERLFSVDPSGNFVESQVSTTCNIRPTRRVDLGVTPSSISAGPSGVVVGGRKLGKGALVTVKDGSVTSTAIADIPIRVAQVSGVTLWIDTTGRLRLLSGRQDRVIAYGAADVIAVNADNGFWSSFPNQRRVELVGRDGRIRRVLKLPVRPDALTAPVSYERGRAFHTIAAVARDTDGKQLWAVDPDYLSYVFPSKVVESAYRATFSAPDRGGFIWAATGRSVIVAEALRLSAVHRIRTDSPVRALLSNGVSNEVTAITQHRAVCITWNPLNALRFPSAVAGGLLVGAVFLIAVRLTGSTLYGLLAALLMSLDGFTYTLARLAGPDSIVAALVVLSWFCLLSALHASSQRRHRATRAWLAAAGGAAGLAAATKWNGFWALAGLGFVLLWDARRRGEGSLKTAFGTGGLAVLGAPAVLAAAVAIAYASVWVVHAGIVGAGLGEVIRDHSQMYAYHTREASGYAPAQSMWYQWPIGARPVPIFVAETGAHRAEMWILTNPVVVYTGVFALLGVAIAAVRRRQMDLMIPLIAAAAEFVPWIYVDRIQFLYQYALVTPMLVIAVVLVLARTRRRRLAHYAAPLLVIAAIAGFVYLFPMMAGVRMNAGYFVGVRHTLPWMFEPPRVPLVG